MFSRTNYMEEDSTKNHLALAKANRISKYTVFCAIRNKYKGWSKNYHIIILVISSKNESMNLKLHKY